MLSGGREGGGREGEEGERKGRKKEREGERQTLIFPTKVLLDNAQCMQWQLSLYNCSHHRKVHASSYIQHPIVPSKTTSQLSLVHTTPPWGNRVTCQPLATFL